MPAWARSARSIEGKPFQWPRPRRRATTPDGRLRAVPGVGRARVARRPGGPRAVATTRSLSFPPWSNSCGWSGRSARRSTDQRPMTCPARDLLARGRAGREGLRCRGRRVPSGAPTEMLAFPRWSHRRGGPGRPSITQSYLSLRGSFGSRGPRSAVSCRIQAVGFSPVLVRTGGFSWRHVLSGSVCFLLGACRCSWPWRFCPP